MSIESSNEEPSEIHEALQFQQLKTIGMCTRILVADC